LDALKKANWLHAAEIFDSWRVMPRLLILSMLVWTIDVVDNVLTWYMQLRPEAQTIQASGLAASIVATVTGLWTVVFKIYSATGRDWTVQPEVTTSVTAVSSSTAQRPP
jgi:hypothetical protein